MIWLCSEINLCPFSGSIYIYIYISTCHMTILQSDWLPLYRNMYNICKLHSLICMCSGTCSGCHSLSNCTFLYKYGYETSPFYKKKFFVIELLVSYYIEVYYHYSVHCVVVAKTAIHCVMGR